MTENVLGAFIDAEVSRAETDFKSFRERAVSVVSVAATLATVLTGLLALAADKDEKLLPDNGAGWLGLAMAFLVLSAVLGLMVHVPARVRAADVTELQSFVGEHWDDEGWDRSVAELQVKYLEDLRKANKSASHLFTAALAAQLLAVVSLAILSWRIFDFLT